MNSTLSETYNMMLSFLKNHPFAVEAYFESSVVLTFAIPKAQLEHLIPECLTLDTFQDEWGFVAIAMVQTTGLRPKGFPKILGSNFFLTGYRIFVKYNDHRNKRLRGLYILKSKTDSPRMKILGNVFTHYNYSTIDLHKSQSGNTQLIRSEKSGLEVRYQNGMDASLPKNSPFENWKEARRYAGPLPFTFTYNASKKEVLIIEGVRSNWKPTPINILDYKSPFLESYNFKDYVLANAFEITNIPYYWKPGKIEKWQQ